MYPGFSSCKAYPHRKIRSYLLTLLIKSKMVVLYKRTLVHILRGRIMSAATTKGERTQTAVNEVAHERFVT